MSEERDVVHRELLGDGATRKCATCGLPKDSASMILVPAETLGHSGGGNVDICEDCFRSLQRGDVEPVGDPEF